MIIQENYNLQNKNSFGLNVSSKYFCTISSKDELANLIDQVKSEKVLLLGGGSNILFTKNYDGCVIQFNRKGITTLDEDKDTVLLEVFAGELWDDFVAYCVENNYYGIENMSLIPGTVG